MSYPVRSVPKWATSRVTGEHFMPTNLFAAEPRFLFIHIPKSAGSSIQRWLHEARFPKTRLPEKWDGNILWNFHTIAREFRARLGTNYDSFYKFAIVRNPYDRLLSMYKFHQTYPNPSVNLPETFEEYARSYDQTSHDAGHVGRLVDYVLDESGQCIVDFIGRYENLYEDLQTIAKAIDIPLPKTFHRENTSTHKHYREHYTDEAKEIVTQKFQADLDYFNYEF